MISFPFYDREFIKHFMSQNRKKIALFGSSFNPPQLGHLAVIKDVLKQNLYDEIWLVPVYQHPFGKDLASFEDRMNMLSDLVLEINDPRVKICTIEKELNRNPSYMYDTIQALKKHFPHSEFFLIAGTDIKNELHKWYQSEKLQKILKFHFIPRLGYEDSPYPEVSSTEIREKMAHGESIEGLTTTKIVEYIKNNNLYI